jgi:regulator of replication initiation timing
MTPLDILLKLIGFAIDKAQQGQMDEMREALTKVSFELEKRKEVELFNHEESEKMRMENKSLRDRNTALVLENNKLKQMLQNLPED